MLLRNKLKSISAKFKKEAFIGASFFIGLSSRRAFFMKLLHSGSLFTYSNRNSKNGVEMKIKTVLYSMVIGLSILSTSWLLAAGERLCAFSN